jgi:hypothetical protein
MRRACDGEERDDLQAGETLLGEATHSGDPKLKIGHCLRRRGSGVAEMRNPYGAESLLAKRGCGERTDPPVSTRIGGGGASLLKFR